MSETEMKDPVRPVVGKSSTVDLDSLVAGMPAGAQKTFEERTAAHQAARLVRAIRRNAQLTQQQLAEAIGTTQEHVSDLERATGPNGPTVGLLNRVARACGERLVISTERELQSESREAAEQPLTVFALTTNEADEVLSKAASKDPRAAMAGYLQEAQRLRHALLDWSALEPAASSPPRRMWEGSRAAELVPGLRAVQVTASPLPSGKSAGDLVLFFWDDPTGHKT